MKKKLLLSIGCLCFSLLVSLFVSSLYLLSGKTWEIAVEDGLRFGIGFLPIPYTVAYLHLVGRSKEKNIVRHLKNWVEFGRFAIILLTLLAGVGVLFAIAFLAIGESRFFYGALEVASYSVGLSVADGIVLFILTTILKSDRVKSLEMKEG